MASTRPCEVRPSTSGHQGLDAGGVEHTCRGAVDVGHHGRLHAAQQHQHLARVCLRRPAMGARTTGGRHLGLQRRRQQRAHHLAHLHGRAEQRRGQAGLEQPAHGFLAGRALHAFLHDLAADIHQVAVGHAAGTGGLAVAAGQAAVQVQLRLARDRRTFQHLLHQVDAAARAVEFVAQQLVGGASGEAEAAVHAFAQDGLGLLAVVRALEFGSQVGLHGRKKGGPEGRGQNRRAIKGISSAASST